MSQQHPSMSLAFFGATGGCAGYCLAHSLKAGYTCTALARTPQKLIAAMQEKGVPRTTIDNNLTIIQGDVKNLENVKCAIQTPSGQVVDTIISGIGGKPTLKMSIKSPVDLTDPSICSDAGITILRAARELAQSTSESQQPQQKPLFVNISTTGIPSPGSPWDVPSAMSPMYRWTLRVPHHDKAKLEEKLRDEVKSVDPGIRGYINIKPSLLTDGEGKGLKHVRQGIDDYPAVGYTIQRGDVGRFMFEKLVVGPVREEWTNKSLSITY